MTVSRKQQSRLQTSMNAMMKALARIGIAFGPVHILSVPGRTSGLLHSTPVSPFEHGGWRYVLAGENHADWVKNVRSAGWAYLQRGRSRRQQVRLVEVPADERGPMLEAYGEKIPGGSMVFKRYHGISGEPGSFAPLASLCPVFRIDPI